MIDEKKIQEAADGMFNAGSLVNAAEQMAFERGVYWFKKSLWHSQDEIPEDGRIILVKGMCIGTDEHFMAYMDLNIQRCEQAIKELEG